MLKLLCLVVIGVIGVSALTGVNPFLPQKSEPMPIVKEKPVDVKPIGHTESLEQSSKEENPKEEVDNKEVDNKEVDNKEVEIPGAFDTFKVSVSISTTENRTSEEALVEIEKILKFLRSAPNIKKSELAKVEAGTSADPKILVEIYSAE